MTEVTAREGFTLLNVGLAKHEEQLLSFNKGVDLLIKNLGSTQQLRVLTAATLSKEYADKIVESLEWLNQGREIAIRLILQGASEDDAPSNDEWKELRARFNEATAVYKKGADRLIDKLTEVQDTL